MNEILHNNLSEAFVTNLRTATLGYLNEESFTKLLSNFEGVIKNKHFTQKSEANLHRIIFSLYDKVSFLSDCAKYPLYAQILLVIALHSNYLTDVIVRNPEFLYWIVNTDNLNERLNPSYIKAQVAAPLEKYKTFNSKVNLLRLVKRRELLRIGINDILGNSDLQETTKQLSLLAKSLNSILFELCYKEILSKYNIQIKKNRYCLIALGKLGGNELNYSSDVDLIVFFDRNSSHGKLIKKEFYELLTEATQLFIQNSTAVTDKGYLYRVDFRLRPDGRNSLLCRTLKDILQYYEIRGEDWERQMLIKVSFVGGNEELYESFYNYIQHFIYPTSFSVSPLNQIAVMKNNIEKSLGEKENIKLFSGGIRDIEFSVQALQLLNGGKIKSLRTGNTIDGLNELRNHNIISNDEHSIFTSGYIFYRKIEHYLQLMNDIQTHTIPDNEETLERIARFFDLKNSASLRKKIEHTRRQVKNIYDSIVNPDLSSDKLSFETIQFFDTKKAIDNYKFLQTGQGILQQKQFDKQTISSFLKVENTLIKSLQNSSNPDLMLDNFVKVIKSRPLPSIWYNEFLNDKFFSSFLVICELSQKSINLMLIDKILGDFLLNRKAFITDLEEHYEDFSVIQFIFILSTQYCLQLINQDQTSLLLSGFLKLKLIELFERESLNYDFFVIGLGSFGTKEMTFSSDIDIIIVAKNVNLNPGIEKDFQNCLLKINKFLKPFEVDVRLRPEGKSSQLVWDIETYYEYFDKRVQNWELQALTRIDFIFGNQDLFNSFLGAVKKRITKIDPPKLKTDIIDMRNKVEKQVNSSPQASFGNFFNIKKSKGGINDISFSLQYLILNNPASFNDCEGYNTISLLYFFKDILGSMGCFSVLENNYIFLKKLELTMQILFDSPNSVIPVDKQKRLILAKSMHYKTPQEFEKELTSILKSNIQCFEKILL